MRQRRGACTVGLIDSDSSDEALLQMDPYLSQAFDRQPIGLSVRAYNEDNHRRRDGSSATQRGFADKLNAQRSPAKM